MNFVREAMKHFDAGILLMLSLTVTNRPGRMVKIFKCLGFASYFTIEFLPFCH